MKKKANILVLSLAIFVFGSVSLFGQADKERRKLVKESKELMSDASLELQKDEFSMAEANYRKAIAINPVSETGKYNLGTAYYGKSKNTEALNRFKQAAEVATARSEKHRAFHNLGNTLMNEKNYAEAVEAYKNALRNDPTDDESRYNLALAKDLLEKNPPQDDDGEDENKDKDNKENEDNKDEGKDKEGDEDDEKENKDKGDEKDENKEGDEEKDKGKPDEPKDKKGDKPQEQQPVPGQLSPQQVKSLLEAMNNEEKKVQDKINAQKQKGAKVKSNKDW